MTKQEKQIWLNIFSNKLSSGFTVEAASKEASAGIEEIRFHYYNRITRKDVRTASEEMFVEVLIEK